MFARDPSKAWGERFFLCYTPIWIGMVALCVSLGWFRAFSDAGYLAFGIAVAAPLVLYPLLRPGAADRGRPITATYWFRFNVWIAIFGFVGNYSGSHYFFDVLGMRYAFPTTWTLEATLVGRGSGTVPIFLYLLTQAYFATYHAVAGVVIRAARRRLGPGHLTMTLVVCALAYGMAFAETWSMASDLLSDVFWYVDRARMLRWGSVAYGLYFIVSFPMIARLDEEAPWPLWRVAVEALAASMLVMLLLDFWAALVGPL